MEERHRQLGVAIALCSRLLLQRIESGLRPDWDAANRESVRLAKTLGHVYQGTYEAYYHTEPVTP